MLPRLYMHTIQHVSYHPKSKKVTFETRLVTGRRFHFVLTKEQFLSFNDALLLIEREKLFGHFPLGYTAWLHYNAFNVCLYKETQDGKRVEFLFIAFEEYKRVTHKRLLSLVRLKEKKDVEPRERQKDGERIQRQCKDKPTSHQRPLSAVLQPTDRSPSPKRARREEWEASSGSTDNAVLPFDEKESVILSKRKSASTRRRRDSVSSNSSYSKDLLSPSSVQLYYPDSDECMETE